MNKWLKMTATDGSFYFPVHQTDEDKVESNFWVQILGNVADDQKRTHTLMYKHRRRKSA